MVHAGRGLHGRYGIGLMPNNRRGLFLWPALAQSAFVFDKIHAYDDRLFRRCCASSKTCPDCRPC